MIALLQRVSEAAVRVDGEAIASIGFGALALIGVERGDTPADGVQLATRVSNLRMFDDADGRMNLDLDEAGGALLVVSQFTLAADTRKGRRPGFSTAAAPDAAQPLFEQVVAALRRRHGCVRTGRFGAHMQVSLINDGPVTFRLQVPPTGTLQGSPQHRNDQP